MSAPRPASRIWPRLVLAGVPLYAILLVAGAPATVAAWLLARASAGAATLEQPEGGLWRGRAATLAIATATPGSPPLRLDNVAWSLSAQGLLQARLAIHVSTDGSTARGSGIVAPRLQSLRVSEVAITIPASTLAVLFPMLQLAGLGGQVAARSSDLTVSRDEVRGSADVQWIDAASTLSPLSPLGSYRARVEGTGAAATLKVSTEKGSLQIVGSGTWSAAQGLQFSGEARPAAPQAAALQPLLKLFGPPDSQGNRLLRYDAPTARR